MSHRFLGVVSVNGAHGHDSSIIAHKLVLHNVSHSSCHHDSQHRVTFLICSKSSSQYAALVAVGEVVPHIRLPGILLGCNMTGSQTPRTIVSQSLTLLGRNLVSGGRIGLVNNEEVARVSRGGVAIVRSLVSLLVVGCTSSTFVCPVCCVGVLPSPTLRRVALRP